MTLWALILIGISLSMDAFAIAILNSIAYAGAKKQVIVTALAFGAAQAAMPVIGYLLGVSISDIISAYDHWVAFGLLVIIGGNMLIGAIRDLRSNEEPEPRRLTAGTLFVQAIATSIDALAVGIGFAALQVKIGSAALIIGCTTFIICLFGGAMGCRIGKYLQKYAALLGGVILILLGVKILLEHMA